MDMFGKKKGELTNLYLKMHATLDLITNLRLTPVRIRWNLLLQDGISLGADNHQGWPRKVIHFLFWGKHNDPKDGLQGQCPFSLGQIKQRRYEKYDDPTRASVIIFLVKN